MKRIKKYTNVSKPILPIVFSFLRDSKTNKWNRQRVIVYGIFVIFTAYGSLWLADNSELYVSDIKENQKFIKLSAQNLRIIDTVTTRVKQSYFNNYKAIQLENEQLYRLNIKDTTNSNAIVPHALLTKKPNNTSFTITYQKKNYFFIIEEFQNTRLKIYFFLLSCFLSFVFVPIYFNTVLKK